MSPLTSTDADSRADHAAAEGLEANVLGPGIAQFFVVPWEIIRNTAGEPISVTCKYFDYKGEPVGAQPMTCPHAFFLLTQGGPPSLPRPTEPVDVALFSATARTLSSSCLLNSSFNAAPLPDGSLAVTVPVAPETTRGVILVFRYPAIGPVQGLVASSDPEIKNTSGTSEQPA